MPQPPAKPECRECPRQIIAALGEMRPAVGVHGDVVGVRLLIDPTFDPPGTYTLPHVTLEKQAPPALDAAAFGRIDAALLSHDQHADNLSHAGRDLLGGVPAVFTTPAGAGRLGSTARRLAPLQTVEAATPGGRQVHVTATPARHGPVGIEPLSATLRAS